MRRKIFRKRSAKHLSADYNVAICAARHRLRRGTKNRETKNGNPTLSEARGLHQRRTQHDVALRIGNQSAAKGRHAVRSLRRQGVGDDL